MDALEIAGVRRVHPDAIPLHLVNQADHRRQRDLPSIHRAGLCHPARVMVPARKAFARGLEFDAHHLHRHDPFLWR